MCRSRWELWVCKRHVSRPPDPVSSCRAGGQQLLWWPLEPAAHREAHTFLGAFLDKSKGTNQCSHTASFFLLSSLFFVLCIHMFFLRAVRPRPLIGFRSMNMNPLGQTTPHSSSRRLGARRTQSMYTHEKPLLHVSTSLSPHQLIITLPHPSCRVRRRVPHRPLRASSSSRRTSLRPLR